MPADYNKWNIKRISLCLPTIKRPGYGLKGILINILGGFYDSIPLEYLHWYPKILDVLYNRWEIGSIGIIPFNCTSSNTCILCLLKIGPTNRRLYPHQSDCNFWRINVSSQEQNKPVNSVAGVVHDDIPDAQQNRGHDSSFGDSSRFSSGRLFANEQE